MKLNEVLSEAWPPPKVTWWRMYYDTEHGLLPIMGTDPGGPYHVSYNDEGKARAREQAGPEYCSRVGKKVPVVALTAEEAQERRAKSPPDDPRNRGVGRSWSS